MMREATFSLAMYGHICFQKCTKAILLYISQMTVSLTDIALQCLCTSSGTHRQNYVLVAAEAAKAYAKYKPY